MPATTRNHYRFAHTALRLLIDFSVTLVNIHNLCDALQLLWWLMVCKHAHVRRLLAQLLTPLKLACWQYTRDHARKDVEAWRVARSKTDYQSLALVPMSNALCF